MGPYAISESSDGISRQNPSTVSSYLGVPKGVFEQNGVFNASLGIDSKFYVDPLLLQYCDVSELVWAHTAVTKGYRLPLFGKKTFLLVPDSIVTRLPCWENWSEPSGILTSNAVLRKRFTSIIGHTWKDASRLKNKAILSKAILENRDLLEDLIEQHKRKPASIKSRLGE